MKYYAYSFKHLFSKTWLRTSLGAALAFWTLTTPATPLSTTNANKSPTPIKHAILPIDWIDAVVNDDVITHLELAARIKAITQRMQAQKLPLPPEADLERQVLDHMIIERLQLQAANENGIRVDDMTLDHALSRIASQNHMDLAQFQKAVAAQGLDFTQLRNEIRNEILLQRLRENNVDSKVHISDAQINSFLKQQALQNKPQMKYHLAEILIRVPENANTNQIAVQRSHAEDIMRQLKSGANFARLAATYSDANSALKGGDLGWHASDHLLELIAHAVEPLSTGQNTGILRTPYGFYILQMLGKRESNSNPTASTIDLTHARHILIKVNAIMSAAQALAKLKRIRAQILSGKLTFAQAAKEYSEDGSRDKGGDLGWLSPGETVPAFEEAMNALKPNIISEPIESPFGYHLIEVLDRKTADNSADQKRKEARTALRDQKIKEAYEDFLSQLRNNAYISIRKND